MPPHSLCTSSNEPRQQLYLASSTSTSSPSSSSLPSTQSFSLHRPLLAQDMKKTRNTKQLSLKVSPSPEFYISDINTTITPRNNTSLPLIVTPSPSFPPTSTSLSSRRPFTPAPLLSASLNTTATASQSTSPIAPPATSKRQSQLSLDDALPTPRLPLPGTTNHRSISAYFSDYSVECGAASPYTSEPVRVLPNLYLGAEHNASDIKTLKRLGITFVLNVAIEIAQDDSKMAPASTRVDGMEKSSNGVEYRSLAWTHHQRSLLRDFPTAFALLDKAMAGNNGTGKALVHCQLGVSRSASLVIAYVMRSQGIGLTEAYDFVKQQSGVISPNMSLMYQLAEFEKSLKNPGKDLPNSDSASDSASVRSRNSWCSQLDDDEPPYPFSAAISAAMASPTLSSIPPIHTTTSESLFDVPPTPSRQEFCKRPLTPETGNDDHPNTKPFQTSHRLASPKSFSLARRNSLSLQQNTRALSRPTYQRSPLASSVASHSLSSGDVTTTADSLRLSPKTPTTASFSSLSLDFSTDTDMMVPPTPLFQSSFTLPSLSLSSSSSSSSSSSASSVASFEACPRPSTSSTTSSTYFTACDGDDEFSDMGADICSPRNSGTWSILPCAGALSTPSLIMMSRHEQEKMRQQQQEEQERQQQQQQQRKKKNLWSGLKALQVMTETSLSGASSSATSFTFSSSASTTSSSSSISIHSAEIMDPETVETTDDLAAQPEEDFIFSPRPYSPTHHRACTFDDFYQALCT
ncbi:Dual specificity protein phosphatase 9 [Haplosporangium sp. Z 767]|nr:Dual specificity protein phosphatase 9 [Haplosporangium sp. Z 767]